MIKKMIITLLLLVSADYALNSGLYTRSAMDKIRIWSAESSHNISHSIFAA